MLSVTVSAFLPRRPVVYYVKVSAFTVGALTETTTFQRFTELIGDGFGIVRVSSTWDHLIIEMEDDHRRTVVRMNRDAARSFLDAPPTNAKPVAAGPR